MTKLKTPPKFWTFPPRSLGQLMTVVALSGLAVSAFAPRGGLGVPPPRARRFMAAPAARTWAVPNDPALPAADPIIFAAPAGIDDRMVVAAPPGIDDRMVVAPGPR